MDSKSLRVGFIGAGRAANVLAAGLHEKGYRVTAVASRTPASAEALARRIEGCTPHANIQEVADACDLVFITAPDDAIEAIAGEVRWRNETGVAHCSGAESASILEAARHQGASVGSFHPMQTFASANQGAAIFSGVAFAVEGSSPLIDTLKEMANALGGWPVEIRPEHRALYHLSGFLACGLMTAQIGQAAELWKVMGYTKEQGLEVLLPILHGTVDSLESQGIPAALTGPISRGDVGTVRKHLEALESYAPSLISLYCHIAIGAVKMAREKGGIDQVKEQEFNILLEERLARAGTLFVG
ncbi:MAG: DUF2520 domain-containing protein [Chloroflexi bacterium]|nr:DUF2520 domain-containing protein [Chloroflexota bacterium]